MRKAVLLIGILAAGWYFLYRCGEELEDGGCGKRGKWRIISNGMLREGKIEGRRKRKMLKAVTLAVMAALVVAAVATGYLLYQTGRELNEEQSNRGRKTDRESRSSVDGRIPEEHKDFMRVE